MPEKQLRSKKAGALLRACDELAAHLWNYGVIDLVDKAQPVPLGAALPKAMPDSDYQIRTVRKTRRRNHLFTVLAVERNRLTGNYFLAIALFDSKSIYWFRRIARHIIPNEELYRTIAKELLHQHYDD
jgi:hypothetical protein